MEKRTTQRNMKQELFMGVGFNPLPIYKMEQTKTKLQNFVKRIKKEAYEEGFADGYEKGLFQDVLDE